jgi:hypothetical protein
MIAEAQPGRLEEEKVRPMPWIKALNLSNRVAQSFLLIHAIISLLRVIWNVVSYGT